MPCSWLQGQGISNLWLMGYDCGAPPQCGGTNIDFILVHRILRKFIAIWIFVKPQRVYQTHQGSCCFYTNGIYVANRNNALMLNGDSLNPSDYTDTWRNDGLKISQGAFDSSFTVWWFHILSFPWDSFRFRLSAGSSLSAYRTFILKNWYAPGFRQRCRSL